MLKVKVKIKNLVWKVRIKMFCRVRLPSQGLRLILKKVFNLNKTFLMINPKRPNLNPKCH